MISAGEAYKPTGRFDFSATVFAATTGIIAAAVVAAIVWAWETSGIPTLVIVTSIFHGLAIGAVLAWLFRRARLRNPMLATLIAAGCALGSVVLVDYGHYLWFLHEFEPEMSRQIDEMGSKLTPETRQRVLARIHSDPAAAADAFILEPKTDHDGFAGYMMFRADLGESIGSHGTSNNITGWACWGLWIIEAGFVVGAAIALAHVAARKPFCEDCGKWFGKPSPTLYAPVSKSQQLLAAVMSGDPKNVTPMHALSDFDPTLGSSAARIYSCPDCAQRLADVVIRTPKPKNKGFEEKKLMQPIAISSEMESAIRNPPPLHRELAAAGAGSATSATLPPAQT